MEKIDWYYIYSQRYYPFHLYLQDKIPKDIFEPKGVFIDQSVFEKHLYKNEGKHFFHGITIKIETIIQILEKRIEEKNTSSFFFSDCDILIGDLASTHLKLFVEVESPFDIWFQKEYLDSDIINPGFMLIKPSVLTLLFWKNILIMMKAQDKMEMNAINDLVKEKTINYSFFPLEIVNSSITAKGPHFAVHHILCNGIDSETDMRTKFSSAYSVNHPMTTYLQQTFMKYGKIYL